MHRNIKMKQTQEAAAVDVILRPLTSIVPADSFQTAPTLIRIDFGRALKSIEAETFINICL